MKHGKNEADELCYLHRVGRTGRFGRLGIAVNILTSEEDFDKIQQISDKLKLEMDSFENEDMDKIIE